jgi:membrane associated rhomboid family serine protease
LGVLWPEGLGYVALIPQYLSENGYIWTLLTYALVPANAVNFAAIAALVLYFGWYIEPMLGRLRQTILLIGAALCSGLAYFAFEPAPGSALIGGLFVASAVGVAFLCWSIPNRVQFQSGLRIFWLLAACWIAYTLWASPVSLSAVHVVSWLVGFVVAIGPVRRFARSPNNALQATREDARA